MKPKKIPFNEFVSIYKKVPRLCIEVLIKNDKGLVLSKRSIKPWKGQWHFPGGSVLRGEKIEDTISRVAMEETGLQVKIEKFVGIIEYISPRRGAYGHGISLAYLVKPTDGTLRGSEQGKEIKYFSTIPDKTIREQADFLINSNLLTK